MLPLTASTAAQLRDGPAACSSGNPPFPYHGFCATYSGANTFYGTYGPGFPTPTGFGLCANSAAGGGGYPAPGYRYGISGAPAGANLSQRFALGYALSEFEALGRFGGSPGRFTADQAAVAAKLVYDSVAWGRPLAGYDPGVGTAVNDLLYLMGLARGASGAPTLRHQLVPTASSFTGSTIFRATLAFPGSNTPVPGMAILLSVSGGSFERAGGPTTALGTTDANGRFEVSLFAGSSSPSSVEVTSLVSQGVPELSFWQPTAIVTSAQKLVAFDKPVAVVSTSAHATNGSTPPTTGRVKIIKHGDAEAYVPVVGATFLLRRSGTTYDTLVVNDAGVAGPSQQVPSGTYNLVESVPPPGYEAAPNRQVVVTTGTTTVTYDGAQADQATRATLRVAKRDLTTGDLLAGATFQLRYDAANAGTYDIDLGTCVTDATGTCGFAAGGELPGRYELTEVAAPPGYALKPDRAPHHLLLSPGETITIDHADRPLLVLALEKVAARDHTVHLAGAVLDLYRMDDGAWTAPPAPGNAALLAGGSWVDRLTSTTAPTTVADLLGGFAYCVVEHTAPPGYLVHEEPLCTEPLTAGADLSLPAATLQVPDDPVLATVQAFKFNSTEPNTGVPDATYDLYVEGAGPPGTPATAPADAAAFSGHAWFARGLTDAEGNLTFEVPVGFRWCFHELTAPPEYLADPGLHCTHLAATRANQRLTLAVSEVPIMVDVAAYKFNALTPYTGVPGASYALFVQGAFPEGFEPPATPAAVATPPGMAFWGQGTTSTSGDLRFHVPAGHAWCFVEIAAPSPYLLDPGVHCTGVVDETNAPAPTVAIAEVEGLASTGGSPLPAVALGIAALAGGLLVLARRRRP